MIALVLILIIEAMPIQSITVYPPEPVTAETDEATDGD